MGGVNRKDPKTVIIIKSHENVIFATSFVVLLSTCSDKFCWFVGLLKLDDFFSNLFIFLKFSKVILIYMTIVWSRNALFTTSFLNVFFCLTVLSENQFHILGVCTLRCLLEHFDRLCLHFDRLCLLSFIDGTSCSSFNSIIDRFNDASNNYM